MPSGVKAPCSDEAVDDAVLRVLRVGVAACFVGHGMLGVMRTAAWASYFAVVGIGRETALSLMPWVGALDILMGLVVLFRPRRGPIFYMMAWCVWTALLRPLAGESFWEAIERAGNYGAPLALLFLIWGVMRDAGRAGGISPALTRTQSDRIALVLRLTTGLLLLGHGALGWIVHKPILALHYDSIGLPGPTAEPLIGGFECLLGLAVLLKPQRNLLYAVLIWKLATEALSPMAGSSIWVFVEHGGSYAAPLALALLLSKGRPVATGLPSQLPAT